MIDSIRSQFDLLSNEMKSFVEWANGVESKEVLNKDFDQRLRARESDLIKREGVLKIAELKVKSDNLLVDSRFNDLEKEKSQLRVIESKLENLKNQEVIIKEKQLNLDDRERIISDKEVKIAEMMSVKDELDHREKLLKKEMLMDRNRQIELDQREVALKEEENRLQQMSSKIRKMLP